MKNVKKGSLVGIYGPHTQVKCQFKALIFHTYKGTYEYILRRDFSCISHTV